MTALLNLNGKRGLVIGLANASSIAYGCARQFKEAGAQLALSYQNAASEPYVQPLAEQLGVDFYMPCDVRDEVEVAELFARIAKEWGSLDFLLHSIAYAPKPDLHGRVTDCSKQGFLTAMDISCYSFAHLAKYAEPLMTRGGSLLTVSYYGAEKVVPHYNVMGPVKAALECMTRYMAVELGPKGIRVNAISPGAIATRAAMGIDQFDSLLKAASHAPLHHPVQLNDIGNLAAFLVSDLSKNITGGVHFVDAGYGLVD